MAAALLANASWMVTVMLNQDKYLLLGITEQQMGIIAIVTSIAGLFAAGSDYLTRKLGFRKFLNTMALLLGLVALLMGMTRVALLAIICNFFVDFGYGLIGPLIQQLENERVSVKDRATQLSIYGMIVDLISIALSALTSLVAKGSLEALFLLAAAEFIAAIFLVSICYGYGTMGKRNRT